MTNFEKLLEELDTVDLNFDRDPTSYDNDSICYMGSIEYRLPSFDIYFDYKVVEYGNETRATYLQPSEWIMENVTVEIETPYVYKKGDDIPLEFDNKEWSELERVLEKKLEKCC